jgi:hypothetical protein
MLKDVLNQGVWYYHNKEKWHDNWHYILLKYYMLCTSLVPVNINTLHMFFLS